MSNRRDEFKTTSSNPATRFLEWDSNAGGFKYYNKEKGENIYMKTPFKMLILKQVHTVKGWHGKSESGIYANEVQNIGADMLQVKSFKGGVLCSGIYKDIKDKLQGGVYFKSVYAMLSDGSIINFAIKGAAVAAWGDFTKKTSARLPDEWVAVMGSSEEKNGSVKYTIPVFEFRGSISEQDNTNADKAYGTISDYFKGYLARQAEEELSSEGNAAEAVVPAATANRDANKFENAKPAPAPVTTSDDDDDDLPF